MIKKQSLLEQMIALCLLTFIVGVWLGEAIRDVVYGHLNINQISLVLFSQSPVDIQMHPKWLLYSGLFVLLKQKLRLSRKEIHALSHAAAQAFAILFLW